MTPRSVSCAPFFLTCLHTAQLCRECFYKALEAEVHETIVANELFQPGERVAVAASGASLVVLFAHQHGCRTCM